MKRIYILVNAVISTRFESGLYIESIEGINVFEGTPSFQYIKNICENVRESSKRA